MISEIEAVQSTSNDALKTKISCVKNNYYKDPFILEMEPGVSHKKFLPLINRGTFCRVFAINDTLHNILNNYKKLTEKNNIKDYKVNLIILGSGFDTTYFNLMSEGYSNIEVYEYDYKKIIDKKKQLISKSKIISELIAQNKKDNYHLLSCDITKNSAFKKTLQDISNNENDLTIVICECLLVYLEREITIQIISTLTKQFENIYLLEYDLIGPDDPFGKEMIDNLKSRGINLKGFEEIRTIQDQKDRLNECLFETINIIDMLQVYSKLLPANERKRIDRLELMDEFEEFNLLQQHACFGYAYKCKKDEFKQLITNL